MNLVWIWYCPENLSHVLFLICVFGCLSIVTVGLMSGLVTFLCLHKNILKERWQMQCFMWVCEWFTGIVEVNLDRPVAKNSINKEMLKGLQTTFETIHQDSSARVVMITSLVPGVFCAGADLKVVLPHSLSFPSGTFVFNRVGLVTHAWKKLYVFFLFIFHVRNVELWVHLRFTHMSTPCATCSPS